MTSSSPNMAAPSPSTPPPAREPPSLSNYRWARTLYLARKTMKRQILFVDDDSNLLQGLRRMLRPMRTQWEMAFANSGQEALEMLSRSRFDVIVSDVRMPLMDGVELLTHIQKHYPHMVRILLSGQTSSEKIFDAVGPAHQYLAKPCDAETLKATIERACALGDLLSDDNLKQVVSRVNTMPSCPSLYLQLRDELAQEDASIEAVSHIISRDVGMTAKILKLVNSAFFGLPRHISNPGEAVLYLGLETVKTLVLGVQIFQQLENSACQKFSCDTLLTHSLLVAEYAKKLCQLATGDTRMQEDSFTAGFLHDVGILILATQIPELYQQILSYGETHLGSSFVEAERDILKATHAEIGAYLLGLWGLRNSIVEAVAYHHNPSRNIGQTLCPLVFVHIANVFADEVHNGYPVEGSHSQLDAGYLGRLGLADSVPIWREQLTCVSPVTANPLEAE
ncbi:MAG: HDOD domain-containing protein [Nitrospirae bacterium]|nr:MAG: HDOD domain-containing protein [Nitrospirota bacterium]